MTNFAARDRRPTFSLGPNLRGLLRFSHFWRDKRFLSCLRDKQLLSFLADMKDFSIKTPQQLGSVVQGWRRQRGLTQKDAGSKVGLAQKAVSKIELAPGRAGVSLIFKLLAALDLELVVRPRGTPDRRSDW